MNVHCLNPRDLDDGQLDCWRLLASEMRPSNPFLQPEFALAAAQARDDTEVAVVAGAHETVGFLPFHRTGRKKAVAIGEFMNDLQAMICHDSITICPADVCRRAGLRTFSFDHLLASQASFRRYQREIDPCHSIDLSAGHRPYFESKRASGSDIIKQARRKLRKLEREVGPIDFRWSDYSEDHVVQLCQWKREQTRLAKLPDVFQHQWVSKLIHAVARTNVEKFQACLATLRCGDEVVAMHLGVCSGNVLNSWVPTINPDYHRYSPGIVLHLKLIEAAATGGISRIDLGRGENQLKLRLANMTIPLAIGAVNTTLSGQWGSVAYFQFKHWAKSIPMAQQAKRLVRGLGQRLVGAQN
jgi:CelD/BcsL family acetyltransferase involved in cellulose biosynthesis